MAIPENYIDKITKDGESRDICPAADKVRVGNENFDGTNLDDVLNEIAEEIENADDGTVTGVKVGDTTYNPDSQGVVDLSTPFANKVDKETGKGLSTNDYTTEEKTKLAGLPTSPVQSISVNGTAQQKDTNGNVNIEVQAGDKVSVIQPDPADGTFTIRVGSDDFTVNLNHTHPNMAKLIVCEESDLPSTLDPATIYAITDSGETEIEKLIIRGMEFAGGVPDTGMPMVAKPNTLRPLNLGNNTGSGVTALVDVKARNLNYNGSTDGLTVSVGQNSGLLLSYDQTVDATSITIPQLAAETGCQITVKYTGSGALDDGALVFSHDNAVLASVVVVVVVVAPVQVAGVKLTGTQWLETDYHVNTNTKVVMRVTFATNSNTQTTSNRFYYLSCREKTSGDAGNFLFFAGIEQENPNGPFNFCGGTGGSPAIQSIARASMLTPNSTIEIYGTTMSFIPNGGSAITKALSPAISSMANPMVIGYYILNGEPLIFNTLDLTIHELTISEGNEVKRHYVPATLQGVPGLYDTVTGAFISSMVDGEPLVVVQS